MEDLSNSVKLRWTPGPENPNPECRRPISNRPRKNPLKQRAPNGAERLESVVRRLLPKRSFGRVSCQWKSYHPGKLRKKLRAVQCV